MIITILYLSNSYHFITFLLLLNCLASEIRILNKKWYHASDFAVHSLSHVQLFVTPWTYKAFLSFTISRDLLEFMSIESVMLYNHLILCRHPLLLPSIFPSIRIFSNQSVLHIRWPKCWSFSFSPSECSGLISFTGWISLQSRGLSGVFSSTTL